MKNRIFSIVLFNLLCFYLTSCYIESGYDISRKLEKSLINLNDKYVIGLLGVITNEEDPNIDLFQKRGSNEFIEFCFSVHKTYKPREKKINIKIINPVYKLKDNEKLLSFKEIKEYDTNLYFCMENNEFKRHSISFEDRKLGYEGGSIFYLYFLGPVKARLLEYVEFDIVITDEEGNVYNHHIRYDIKTRPIFKIGSTLWEYWSSI